MDVILQEATAADLPVVKNLVPYYIYDMSEHMGWPCRADGRFDGCDGIETYWTEAMVEQLADNRPAVAFWQKVIDRYCDGRQQQRSGESEWGTMSVLLFDNGGPPGR